MPRESGASSTSIADRVGVGLDRRLADDDGSQRAYEAFRTPDRTGPARSAHRRDRGRRASPRTAARSSAATCSSRCRGPRRTGSPSRRRRPRRAPPRLSASARRMRCRRASHSFRSTMRGARWRSPRRGSIRASRGVIAAVTGTSGKTSVAAFTRQIWAALGYEAASVGTIGVVTAEARGLRLADHARSGRTASHAVGTGGRGRHPSRHRGVVARPRPAPARRRACRGRRLHQSEPRSSRLSSERRGLSRGQAPAVRGAGGRRRRRGDRCRSRAQRRGGGGGEEARAEAHRPSAATATASG